MAKNQAPHRALEEWFRIITECRQSGLSDAEWCSLNGIARSTFLCAAKRLRDNAYALPKKNPVKDPALISKQEVVKIDICEEVVPQTPAPVQTGTPLYLDNSHTVEISMGDVNIKLFNDADPRLVKIILNSLHEGNAYVS
ncbi:MAG: IS66 family insertion sequence element accessory protein TnpB [Lachnospiraceae bacterium]|nr:IS66 family insertion sequence element accessory protein TnpB [Lachnospiraceae bacterium]